MIWTLETLGLFRRSSEEDTGIANARCSAFTRVDMIRLHFIGHIEYASTSFCLRLTIYVDWTIV